MDIWKFKHVCHHLLSGHLLVGHLGGGPGQVLLYLLDERAVALHESVQGVDGRSLLHIKEGQREPQVLLQNLLELLTLPDDALLYGQRPPLRQVEVIHHWGQVHGIASSGTQN